MANEHTAKAVGRELPVSTKHCIEIGNLIRGKSVQRAKTILKRVIAKKEAVPMKRFNFDTGHKRGAIGPGRYPENASKEVLALINSAEMNAQNKGLNTDVLYIKVYIANKGSSQWRYGRQRRRQAKRTNLEIVLEEKENMSKKTENKVTKPSKKESLSKEKMDVDQIKKDSKIEVPKEVSKTEDASKKSSKEEKEKSPKEEKKVEEK